MGTERIEELIIKINMIDARQINQDVKWDILEDLNQHLEQLELFSVVDTLPAEDLIKSLGEAKEPNEYVLKTDNGVWWIEHKHLGSGEPLKQWLTDKPISG